MLSYQSVILVGRGEFLGHVISDEGIVVDPSEVDVVLLLGAPKSVTEIGSFWSSTELLLQFV